jgi:hypothetical protein
MSCVFDWEGLDVVYFLRGKRERRRADPRHVLQSLQLAGNTITRCTHIHAYIHACIYIYISTCIFTWPVHRASSRPSTFGFCPPPLFALSRTSPSALAFEYNTRFFCSLFLCILYLILLFPFSQSARVCVWQPGFILFFFGQGNNIVVILMKVHGKDVLYQQQIYATICAQRDKCYKSVPGKVKQCYVSLLRSMSSRFNSKNRWKFRFPPIKLTAKKFFCQQLNNHI